MENVKSRSLPSFEPTRFHCILGNHNIVIRCCIHRKHWGYVKKFWFSTCFMMVNLKLLLIFISGDFFQPPQSLFFDICCLYYYALQANQFNNHIHRCVNGNGHSRKVDSVLSHGVSNNIKAKQQKPDISWFSRAFAKLRKATVSFVMSICLSAWNLTPTGWLLWNLIFRLFL